MPAIKCPFCGKRHTVKILYGLPTYEAFLDEQLGKIKLGGCEIIKRNPTRYCNDCHKSFGKNFETSGIIETLSFFIGGFLDDNYFINISLGSNSYVLKYRHILPFDAPKNSANTPDEQMRILDLEEVIYLERMIKKLYIREWPASSFDKDILDGTQWDIEIKYLGSRRIKKDGSNKFPPYFSELLKAMSRLSKQKL